VVGAKGFEPLIPIYAVNFPLIEPMFWGSSEVLKKEVLETVNLISI